MTAKLVNALAILGCSLIASVAVPRNAEALYYVSFVPSWNSYAKCLAAGNSEFYCNRLADVIDPSGTDVTGVTMSVQYNSSLFTFDQADSGPLGVFSVGGDAPPVTSGSGTEPLALLPDTGFSPGSALPGSTLTYTIGAGLVTLDYEFASPITVASDVNFFILSFNFINPPTIDLASSTVTYAATGPGSDMTTVSFACTTTDGSDTCGSGTPSTGISLDLAIVPEPSGLLLMLVAIGGLGLVREQATRVIAAVSRRLRFY